MLERYSSSSRRVPLADDGFGGDCPVGVLLTDSFGTKEADIWLVKRSSILLVVMCASLSSGMTAAPDPMLTGATFEFCFGKVLLLKPLETDFKFVWSA